MYRFSQQLQYNYGIEQLSTFKHVAGSITLTHNLHKILNLSFIHIYFPYHKCLA